MPTAQQPTGASRPVETPDLDAVIVGAGFAGLYMLHRLRGLGLSARILEMASGVGGTWWWNRYPGARCDVESMQYSFRFDPALQQEWEWSEKYAAQPEILKYAEHIADRYDLRRDISFNTKVEKAHFNEAAGLWTVETACGQRLRARYCIMATGCLSSPTKPHINGLETFKGPVYHTGTWPHESVDFTGKRVAVIGTGSSAIQAIPVIAQQASHVHVFQRTANFSVPAQNHLLGQDYVAPIKADYAGFRERARSMPAAVLYDRNLSSALEAADAERRAEYERRWAAGGVGFLAAYGDLLLDDDANRTAADFVRDKIRQIVHDPKVAELLCPTEIIGCKRLCVDTDYYKTYNRPNVTLVNAKATPIEAITPTGVRTSDKSYEVDAIVLATGFDAMTGTLNKMDIRGRNGVTLRSQWQDGPHTYLGLQVAGFPNLFMITGPGSPSVLTNMIVSIEQHVEFVTDCLAYMRGYGHSVIEPTAEAQKGWDKVVNEVAGTSLRSTCASWYVGSNIPGKPRVFMPYIGGYPAYVKACEEVVANGYAGFVFDGSGPGGRRVAEPVESAA